MTLFRNAFAWFIALLVVLVIGFWRTYFSQLWQCTVDLAHHAHGLAMLVWVLLLISQSWLIRTGDLTRHRAFGRVSFVVAPAVFVTACWVNLHFLRRVMVEDGLGPGDPVPGPLLSIYWFGYFLAIAFAVLFVLAIVHRKKFERHARYMVSTAFVFVIPGLGRALDNYVESLTGWIPSFFQLQALVFLACLWLLFRDWRSGRELTPFAVNASLWGANLVLWLLLPSIGAFERFTRWSAALVT
ncbi:MAG: hypothetical protein R3195_10830 [Gemmatimonadota bacterium]|nr:hypothetical protein [Gemmatimonadota bacterium]